MAAGDVSRSQFGGGIFPDHVASELVSAIIGGAPFAASLHPYPIAAPAAVWGRANTLTGQTWIGELEQVPTVALGSDKYRVATAKIAGILPISLESVEDSALDLLQQTKDLCVDVFSRDLDQGLLYGDGTGENPIGVTTFATEVDAENLFDGVWLAAAEIGEAGGVCNTVAVSPTDYATEKVYRDETNNSVGSATVADLEKSFNIVQVPGLTTPLVYDATRTHLVISRDLQAILDQSFLLDQDALALKISARVAAAVPVVGKTMRKLAITPAGTP